MSVSADQHVVALPVSVVGHVVAFCPSGFRRTCKELNSVPPQVLVRWRHLIVQADLRQILIDLKRWSLNRLMCFASTYPCTSEYESMQFQLNSMLVRFMRFKAPPIWARRLLQQLPEPAE